MKKSILKQEIIIQGKINTANGEIVVTMNNDTKLFTGTNNLTHDEYTKQITLHKIECFINGDLWDSITVEGQDSVLKESQKMKSYLTKRLETIANNTEPKTFFEKMEDIGFK